MIHARRHLSGLQVANRILLSRLIVDLRDAISKIRELVSRPFDELGFYERLALRYLVIELVETAAVICLHVLRDMHGIIVEGYPSCFLEMSRVGLIPRMLGERLARAARLRNLLVHRYWEIDDRRVYEAVRSGLGDFEEYATLVEQVIEDEARTEGS